MAGLLLHFGMIEDVTSEMSKRWIHNVAQFIHCFAQGKVGSGFDVSSAVWGSHLYKRFNPAILKPIMVYFKNKKKERETKEAIGIG